ncbi:hypothetical protein [Burkholderia sp. IMCC1007]|uniref:hypothetical protein n=1 Tax=Burkholderia sp. IMCC1007 TaxID=3004104 RepID=UPI0022B54BCB|nr:hypothetical protein [Burkholderia sp. IMCC1007]
MTDHTTCLTYPIACDDPSVSFSAYGTGWGHVAVKLPAEVIREKLGANTATPAQSLAAFESNRDKITIAVNQHAGPSDGRHIQLDKSDF